MLISKDRILLELENNRIQTNIKQNFRVRILKLNLR